MELVSLRELSLIVPELILVGTFMAGLVTELAGHGRAREAVAGIAILGLVAAALADVFLLSRAGESAFGGMIVRDSFAVYLQVIAALAALLTIIVSIWTSEVSERPSAGRGEYFLLILGATVGMFFLVEATNLLMLYLSMELLSLPSYVLAGWLKRAPRSTEAGIKYLIYGAGASCSMIYGISLLYGLSGSLYFEGLHEFMVGLAIHPGPSGATFVPALLFTLAGFFFKVAAFPLYQWVPDVYEGAPTPITAFLAVGSKAAGMGVLLRFIYLCLASRTGPEAFSALGDINWPLFIAVISAVTMSVGNLVAVAQTNIKRLLAYSSIAHAGYILMGIPVLSVLGLQAMLFYLFVYLLMNFGAFLSVIVFENRGIAPELRNYRGLGPRAPGVAVAFAVFLFSLTGLPPLAGFIGKVYLFAALIKGGLYWLAVVGVLNSVISLYYYANVVRVMFLQKGYVDTRLEPVEVLRAAVWVLAVPTVILGVYWKPVMDIASVAAGSFGLR